MTAHFMQILWKVPYAPTSYNFAWMQIDRPLALELLRMRREITALRMSGSKAEALIYPHESPQYTWHAGPLIDLIDVGTGEPFSKCFQSVLIAVTDERIPCDADRCYHVKHPMVIICEDGVAWEGVGPRGLLLTDPIPWRYLEGFCNRLLPITNLQETACQVG